MQRPDAVGNVFGFRFGVARLEESQVRAPEARALEILPEAALIVCDDASRRVENLLRRAVILLEAHDARARIILIESQICFRRPRRAIGKWIDPRRRRRKDCAPH